MRERGAAHFDVGSALLASAAKPCQVGMARGGEGREAGSYGLGVLRWLRAAGKPGCSVHSAARPSIHLRQTGCPGCGKGRAAYSPDMRAAHLPGLPLVPGHAAAVLCHSRRHCGAGAGGGCGHQDEWPAVCRAGRCAWFWRWGCARVWRCAEQVHRSQGKCCLARVEA